MRPFWIRAVCSLLLLAGTAASAEAQQRFAVLIGIAKYQDSRIRPLKYTVRDAQAVYQFLTDPAGGGFPKDNVRLLLNEQATQRAIKNALGQFLPERAVQGDLVFMYYAGHGAPEVDRAKREPDGFSKYLVPYDADYTDLFSTAIDMAEVKAFFDRIESDRVVFVMDACFSGASGGRGFANIPRGRTIKLEGKYVDQLAEGKGRVILTASDANELSLELDSLRHGLFTYHFLQGLQGKADRLGRGYVSLQDLYVYTYEQVARESRRVGGSQSPRMKGDVAGDIILAGRGTPAPPITTQPPGAPPATAPPIALVPPPRPTTGFLVFQGSPAGTKIILDGKEMGTVGQAPLRLEASAGSYMLRLEAPGYRSREARIEVRANTEQPIQYELERIIEALRAGSLQRRGKDNAEMVYIPAGTFTMGDTHGDGFGDEKPAHQVTLDAFWIDRTEVTNAQYARFVQASTSRPQGDWQREAAGKDLHPVVNVTWQDAVAYCRWADKRLPTEAEWEYAARGTDGRKYPWGNTWEDSRARFSGNQGNQTTAPVGSYPTGASPFGLLDLAGNVWEWTSSLYKPYPYVATDGREDLSASGSRVIRGGSWIFNPWNLRAAYRAGTDPALRNDFQGFRCSQGVQ
jgi:formylglycine-generating enzyme required for sulfatase activity